MDKYISVTICRALINVAGDLAIETNGETDLILEQAIVDAALQIEKHGITKVMTSIKKHNPRLHDRMFTSNQGVERL